MRYIVLIALVAISAFSSAVEDPTQGNDIIVTPKISNKKEDVKSEVKSEGGAVASANAQASVINNTYLTRKKIVMQTLPLKQWKDEFDKARSDRDKALGKLHGYLKGVKSELRTFRGKQERINTEQGTVNARVDQRVSNLETQAMLHGWYVPSQPAPTSKVGAQGQAGLSQSPMSQGSTSQTPSVTSPSTVVTPPAPVTVPTPAQPAAGAQQVPSDPSEGGSKMESTIAILVVAFMIIVGILYAIRFMSPRTADPHAADDIDRIGAALGTMGSHLNDGYGQRVSGFIPIGRGGHLRINQDGRRAAENPPAQARPRRAAAPVP